MRDRGQGSQALRRAGTWAAVGGVLAAGAIMAVAMMLDYLGETAAAEEIENVVRQLLADGSIPSLDTRSGITTSQTGDMVVERLRGD